MKIKKSFQEKWLHHTVIVGKIPYYRNEYLTFNLKKNEWERVRLTWGIGDKKGKGPIVAPKGPLDDIGEYTSQELEKMFKKIRL
jgi:hypothetical protein